MKKCPYCGAQTNDDSLFCTECGKQIPQGVICSHCGASLNEGDVFCQSCGKRVDEIPSTEMLDTTNKKCPYCGALVNDGDVFCENCGKRLDEEPTNAVQQPQTSYKAGNLVIRWDGTWALIDTKIKMSVNGNKLGEFSYKEGFEVSVPITSNEMVVVTKAGLYTTKERLNLNPNENYTYDLTYHRMSGCFGFILYDSQGNQIRKDKLHWGLFLLSFILPIIGIIYAVSVWRKKPATSFSAGYASILGIIVSLLVSYNLSSLSEFTKLYNQTAVIETDSIMSAVDTDSLLVDEDISDVYSEAYILHRMQDICDKVPSTPTKTLINNYFSESFRKLYKAVSDEYMKDREGDDVGYFGFYFWSGEGDVEDNSIHSVKVLRVDNFADSTALVTVQDLVKFNDNDELKRSKQLKLVYENEDWFIDDINNHKNSMEEFLSSNEIKSQEELASTNTAIGAFTVEDDSIE